MGTGVSALIALISLQFSGNMDTTWATIAPHALAAMIGVGALATDRLLGARLGAAMLAPLGMLILLVRFFIEPGPRPFTPTPWITGFHVAMALAGQVMAIAACVLSILYSWQYDALKKRRIDGINSDGPALERLDQWIKLTLNSGFVMLTLSLLTGAFFFTPLGGSASMATSSVELLATRAKIFWAVAVWSWYLATLVARNVLRAPVRVIAKMSVIGFALMALAWFGLLFFTVQSPIVSG